jgi:hypothetical protein
MQWMQSKNNKGVQILHSQISPKQQVLWRNKREQTKEKINEWLQDLDLKSSPHLEDELIGEDC